MSKTALQSKSTPLNSYMGAGKYFRFTLKHNLMRYLVWIAVLVLMLAYVGAYYKTLFDTQEKLNEFAAIGATPGMVAMIGKLGNLATMGAAVWTKIWMFNAMTLAIGMVFQVTKGARADEENGRTELFRSRPLGIHSTLASVVGGALLLCFVTGLLSTAVCIGLKLDPAGEGVTGSILFGLSITAMGWIGVGIGALSNQFSSSASLSNSTGSILIMLFYSMRLMGDMGTNDTLTWLSPVGWCERMAPWAENRGWLIIPVIVLTAILIIMALWIESRRDYGAGVLRDKKGRSEARPIMKSSWGLVLHLYKGSIIGWSIGIMLSGMMFGSVAKSMIDLFSDSGIPMVGGSGMDSLLSFLLCFVGLVSVVEPMLIMTGLRSDEANGLTEVMLAKGISRTRIIMDRFIIGSCLAAIMLLLGGLSCGFTYGAAANDMSQTWRLAFDALIYLPGIMAILGVIVLLFGYFPRTTIPAAWFLYGLMYFAVLLSDALKLPDWVLNILPFIGTPKVPYESYSASVFGYLIGAVVFLVLGIAGVKKRDIPG